MKKIVFAISFFGMCLMAGISYDVDASVPDPVCCDVDAQPVPPLCKTQIFPSYREYWGVPYFC